MNNISTHNNFNSLNVNIEVQKKITKIGFTNPTTIQRLAIPKILEGKDVLCSSQTGTGKTGVYVISIAHFLLEKKSNHGIVIVPTRELAEQVHKISKSIITNHISILIGGINNKSQIQSLKQKPRLIIGTPGRINDHINRKTLKLTHFNKIVIDEIDKMLDMGFIKSINTIMQQLQQDKQTIMLSATMIDKVKKLSQQYSKNPHIISAGPKFKPITNIIQHSLEIPENKKFVTLLKELNIRKGKVIIFVNTKRYCCTLNNNLRQNQHQSYVINSNMLQRQRSKVIKNYRDNKFRILIATDILSRGIDIDNIEHVINYDIPNIPEDYIHRIGRTGRAGKKGKALNLITPIDKRKWIAIKKLINRKT